MLPKKEIGEYNDELRFEYNRYKNKCISIGHDPWTSCKSYSGYVTMINILKHPDIISFFMIRTRIYNKFKKGLKEILINEQLDCLPDFVCYDVRGIIKDYLL